MLNFLKNRRWAAAIVVVSALILVPLLTWLRVPCRAQGSMVWRATVLGSVLLLVSLPAVWFLCRALLGRVAGTAGFVFYGLVTLFPYRWLVPGRAAHCQLVAAPPSTALGPAWVLLVLLVLLALLATVLIFRRELKDWLRTLPRTRVVIYALLATLAVTQVAARYGSKSPKSVAGGWHHESTPYRHATFWKVRYGGGDHALHVTPAGLFRGVGTPRTYGGEHLKINRRSVGPFLYAQLTPYLNPYAAAVAVNLVFYLIIVLGGYRLARAFGLSEWLSAGVAVLLSANHFVLWRTVVPYFYLPFDAAFVVLLLGMALLRPLDRDASPAALLQFGALLGVAAISYDANLLVLALLLWWAARARRIDGRFDLRTAGVGLGLAVVPLLVQRGWEGLLLALEVGGNSVDAMARTRFMEKLADLPAYLGQEPWECLGILDHSLSRLILVNRLDTAVVEYWAVLGVVGVIAFFALLPRYVSREHFRDLLLLGLASVALGVLVSLAAALPPKTKIDQFALDPMRTSSAVYAAVVLGQAVALYHLADRLGARGRPWLRPVVFSAGVGLVWVLSFGRLWWS